MPLAAAGRQRLLVVMPLAAAGCQWLLLPASDSCCWWLLTAAAETDRVMNKTPLVWLVLVHRWREVEVFFMVVELVPAVQFDA